MIDRFARHQQIAWASYSPTKNFRPVILTTVTGDSNAFQQENSIEKKALCS